MQYAGSLLDLAEVALWMIVSILFWIKGLGKVVPAMAGYLALHLLETPLDLRLLFDPSASSEIYIAGPFYYAYWLPTIVRAVVVFLICFEVFRSALSPFPGLLKIGVAVLRWAVVISLLLTFTSSSILHRDIQILPTIADGLMRSVSAVLLSLLVFFCICRKALRLSVRDLSFGIALGLGIMSASNFVYYTLISAHVSVGGALDVVHQSLSLVSILVWIVYSLLPRTSPASVVAPDNSTIYRWNEIAAALGRAEPGIAVQKPATSFFLNDVEKVVEKVLNRNLKGRESEL
jgi:hypothetical protein